MKIVVPMAGPEKAFQEAGYLFCKSLIEIRGVPMIEWVVGSLKELATEAQFVFVILKEHVVRHHLDHVLHLLCPGCAVVIAQAPTAGAACTALLAMEHMAADEELVITNGDQIIRAPLPAIVGQFRQRQLDAGTIVFDSVHPRWSFVRVDENDLVLEAAEKQPISRLATTGFYYFRRAEEYVAGAQAMLLKDAHVNGAFYVCPVFNELLLRQKRIGIHRIPTDAYISLATPQGLALFEQRLATEQAS